MRKNYNKSKSSKQLYEEQKKKVPKETHLLVKKLMDFSDQLYKVMKEKNIDEETLVKKSGLKKEIIIRILSGRKDLTMEEITKLEATLDVELIVINHLV